MIDFYKVLYAISAACFIGLGSGLLTLLPYTMDYEAKAMIAGFELEQTTGLDYSKGIECNEFPNIHRDCNVATYLLKTNSTIISFLKFVAYLLLFLGIFTGAAGIWLHLKKGG